MHLHEVGYELKFRDFCKKWMVLVGTKCIIGSRELLPDFT